ncbi:spindle assembly abnormal protein 6-like [Tropilaelaps mercedesae]|uniref:Spindle assembly abnormal protein 6-like n=1 Tax=Tropilaelaps mercedesae TaxID=418985 RepID=A0A1V9XBC2_9ACAR|nr:spindle assembly abnormal protein 6-like [Tropilaelaps mercedesae]
MLYDILSTHEDTFMFDSTLLVKIQDDIYRNARLRLQVRRASGGIGATSMFCSSDGVYVQLFDENDPYVFYSVQITEEVFQRLKVQQHLLIDFASFPQRLVELLQMCASEESLATPRYQCELQVERMSRSGQLHVTEVNGFKKLVHLSVKLSQADETQVRKTIVSRLTRLKHEKDRLEASLKAAESKLAEKQGLYEHQLESQRSQIEKMKGDFERDMQQLRSRFETELRRDKDDIQREMSERVQLMCLEKSDVEATLKERVRSLESEVQNAQLQRVAMESRLAEARAEAQQAQVRLTQEKETCRMLQDRIDSFIRNDSHEENGELRMKLAQMKVDLEALRTDLCKAAMEKRRLEENIEHKQGQLERREEGIKTMSDDIIKANEIIQKLQTEIKTYHSKLKVRADVIMKQEEVIELKDKELSSLRDQIKAGLDDRGNQENDCRIQVLEKQVAHKDNVIQWLNKKLNELQGHKIDTPLLKVPSPLTSHNQAAQGSGRPLGTRPVCSTLAHYESLQLDNPMKLPPRPAADVVRREPSASRRPPRDAVLPRAAVAAASPRGGTRPSDAEEAGAFFAHTLGHPRLCRQATLSTCLCEPGSRPLEPGVGEGVWAQWLGGMARSLAGKVGIGQQKPPTSSRSDGRLPQLAGPHSGFCSAQLRLR